MTKVEINPELCKACGLCLTACKREILIYGEKSNSMGYHAVITQKGLGCIGCRLCAVICPEVAIELYEGEEE